MMNRKKSSIFASLKYLLIVPVGVALLLGNAVQATPELINVATEELLPAVKQDPVKKGNIYLMVDQMPSYPGGEAQMQRFIQTNLRYPVKAQEAKVQGRVVIRFVVTETGEIEDVSIARSLSAECDAEAMRVVKAMPKWSPGKYKGKTVPVYFNVPFVFKLSGGKSSNKGNKTDVAKLEAGRSGNSALKPLVTVEQMPTYPGGDSEMQKFIQSNLKYPAEAQKAKIQGRVTLRFTVSNTGEVGGISVVRGISAECDAEAVRVIKAMPKWNPGKQNGQAVAVYYNLPIQFKLQGGDSSKS